MNSDKIVNFGTLLNRYEVWLICKNYEKKIAHQILLRKSIDPVEFDVWVGTMCVGSIKLDFLHEKMLLHKTAHAVETMFEYRLAEWAVECINTRNIQRGYEIGWNHTYCENIYWNPYVEWEEQK